ncbi:TfoX/Sxy family protein [uncultured Phenylobacterium sp.]|uniref:TfoX/Sxy family protein n=1 Tax=uncultured Phenylobacterium sp. TaxID=349273 RepID=UPI0025D6ECDD|nr:TfoX/Sxy family protein [uncultured Phenylobacterium sp.]
MAWEKSPPWLVELFAASLPERPGLERRRMFGYPVAFANGNMFAGLFGEVVFARLPPGERAGLEAEYGAVSFEPMPGRPMRAYVVIPESVLEDEALLARLLDQAYAFTAAMPPKVRKPRKASR